MTNRDRDYFLTRAEAELDLAQVASHEAAVRAHYIMAGLYLDRVYGPEEDVPSTNEETADAGAS